MFVIPSDQFSLSALILIDFFNEHGSQSSKRQCYEKIDIEKSIDVDYIILYNRVLFTYISGKSNY